MPAKRTRIRNSRSVTLPSAPPSSRPSATAHPEDPSRDDSRTTATATAIASTDRTTVYPVPKENAAPGLRVSRKVSSPSSRETGRLTDSVLTATTFVLRSIEEDARRHDGERPDPAVGELPAAGGSGRDIRGFIAGATPGSRTAGAAPGSRITGATPASGVAQRRSSRCLHGTHSVARGNAINRILPIGFPHRSQMP